MKYDETSGKGSQKSIYLEDSEVYLVFTVSTEIDSLVPEKQL